MFLPLDETIEINLAPVWLCVQYPIIAIRNSFHSNFKKPYTQASCLMCSHVQPNARTNMYLVVTLLLL